MLCQQIITPPPSVGLEDSPGVVENALPQEGTGAEGVAPGKLEFVCLRCGKTFYRYRNKVYPTKFCSRDCFYNLSLFDKFWGRMTRAASGCLKWTGKHDFNGYGLVRFYRHNRAWQGTHRIAWELAVGPIPNGLQVLHHCDVRDCCEPSHLFLGSQAENVSDMIAKGRNVCGVNGMIRKLTEDQVTEMRSLYASRERTQRQLSELFGVTRGHVWRIINRVDWKHI